MENQAPAESITAVLTANPDAANHPDNEGSLPLHLGMANKAPAECVLAVLTVNPGAVILKDAEGHSLLSRAIEYTAADRMRVARGLLWHTSAAALNPEDVRPFFEPNASTDRPRHASLQSLLDAPPTVVDRDGTGHPSHQGLCGDGGWSALEVAVHLGAESAFRWLLDQHTNGVGPGQGRSTSAAAVGHGDPEHGDRVAVRSARTSANATIKAWGEAYGRFLGRYDIEEGDPKHVSSTCCVVFAKDLQAVGPSHERVVLKFMHDPEAFKRELDCRKAGLKDSPAIISILDSYPPTTIAADELKAFPQVRLSAEKDGDDTALDLLLVLERGTTDLSDVISHGGLAGKNMLRVRGIAAGIAGCLRKMHAAGVLHGDVKSRNFVLLPTLEYAAIDLDAAAAIDSVALAGQKPTSSGCLPPEQAAVLLHRRRRAAAVFEHLTAGADGLSEAALSRFCEDLGLDEGARPKPTALDEDGNGQVGAGDFAAVFADVRHADTIAGYLAQQGVGRARSSRDADEPSASDDPVPLIEYTAAGAAAPPPVIASPSYDAWCFGVMLYELATGASLFRVDVREEALDDAELAKIAAWSGAHKKLALERVADKPLRRLLDQLLQKDPARRLASWDDIIIALQTEGAVARGSTSLVSRTEPAQKGQAWVYYGGFYFTASSGDKESSHDEVYRQNPRLEEAVGTEDDPRAEIKDCTQGGGAKVSGEATKLRQAKYGANRKQLALRMAKELQIAEDLQAVRLMVVVVVVTCVWQSIACSVHCPAFHAICAANCLPLVNGEPCPSATPLSQPSRTAHEQGYRPAKGAWVQYGESCYTANGLQSWSHDVVYAQNPLLAEAVGTKDDPTAEIMDVIQGSGRKLSGEATNLRQAKYESSKALFAIQLIEDLRIQKLKVRVGSIGNMVV